MTKKRTIKTTCPECGSEYTYKLNIPMWRGDNNKPERFTLKETTKTCPNCIPNELYEEV